MSVVKSKRTESKLEVLHNAENLTREVSALTARRFGIYSKKSPLRQGYTSLLRKGMDLDHVDRIIDAYVDKVYFSAIDISGYLHSADSIYPKSIEDLQLRREYQNKAIAECRRLRSYLHNIVNMFDVDILVFENTVTVLDRELSLIKRWRTSDNKFKGMF